MSSEWAGTPHVKGPTEAVRMVLLTIRYVNRSSLWMDGNRKGGEELTN